jgi:hypothetical protein
MIIKFLREVTEYTDNYLKESNAIDLWITERVVYKEGFRQRKRKTFMLISRNLLAIHLINNLQNRLLLSRLNAVLILRLEVIVVLDTSLIM